MKKTPDVANQLTDFKLYDNAEKQRWMMHEINWSEIDRSFVSDSLVETVKKIAFGELTTFSATREFMTLFSDDIDFTQWLSIWLYEETKHPHVFIKWLAEVGEKISSDFITEGRVITTMSKSKVEMLTFNIISEIVAGYTYIENAKNIEEKVLSRIMTAVGKDELRHSIGFESYCREYIKASEDPDRERIICLKAACFFMQEGGSIHHPVAQTMADLNLLEGVAMSQATNHICKRIGKLVGAKITHPRDIYITYKEYKKAYRQKHAAISV